VRTLTLSKSGIQKVRSHLWELKYSDFEESVKSLTPGEWCYFSGGSSLRWVGFVNPLVDSKYTCANIVSEFITGNETSPESIIKAKISKALQRRYRFKDYDKGSRLFYGASDGLPGLIIDQFENATIIQINSAGMDRYRDLVRESVQDHTKRIVYFLDNPKYRDKESLPTFDSPPLPDLTVRESDLLFSIRPHVMQKVGFYYDHRENRNQLRLLLSRLKHNYQNGVDLFSYVGAWGLAALKGGLNEVSFIDQGDFSFEVTEGLRINGLEGRGLYERTDVFSFLDKAVSEKRKFDVVMSDPPAFAKSAVQKKQALDGYSKLHRKIFKLIRPGGLVVFSSCTHYVSHSEFQKNVLDASEKEGRQIQLLFSGLQGWDHPIKSQDDRSNYIKSYFYLVE
jgi:23S rRNA (cytosine1962-C5)-methyltransferase